MQERTVEDRLRQQYFELLPEIRRVEAQLKAGVQFHTIPILRSLGRHEQLIVKSRVKECESAVDSLRRRQDGARFDPERFEEYSLLELRDLAGVRVLAFPGSRLAEIDRELRDVYPDWRPDPVTDESGATLAIKYFGKCREASERVQGEFQIVSMLTGLFWEVEHSAIYKPSPALRGIARSLEMRALTNDVQEALSRFEEGFERLLHGGNT